MKILFYDLDGTVLVNGEVSARCRAALEEVRRRGCMNVLNTGRSPGYVPPDVRDLPVWDGFICGSAYISWRGELLSSASLSRAQIGSVLAVCEEKRIPVVFEGVTNSYSLGCEEPDLRLLLKEGILPAITKITFWCDPRRVVDEDFPGFRILRFRNYAEGILEDFDKKTGMEMIMRREGLGRSDLWAFGDSENDLDMLRFAGNAVCMAAAPPEFDDFCVWRCKTGDGVPEALEKFFLN